jgi:hypothetical protein
VAVAALLIWLCTAAIGSYLLVKAISAGSRSTGTAGAGEAGEPVSVAAEPAAATAAAATAAAASKPATPRRRQDPFAPPTLQRAREEPLPGLRDLAEFAHPALAVIGFGFWFGYVITRDLLFAAIGLGIVLGAIAAGVSWFIVNRRSAASSLRFTPRLLVLHGLGAGLTLLLVALVTARV